MTEARWPLVWRASIFAWGRWTCIILECLCINWICPLQKTSDSTGAVSGRGKRFSQTCDWWKVEIFYQKALQSQSSYSWAGLCPGCALTTWSLNRYYELLEQTLREHDLLDKPCQIFNLDETGMAVPAPPKVVAPKEQNMQLPSCQ